MSKTHSKSRIGQNHDFLDEIMSETLSKTYSNS